MLNKRVGIIGLGKRFQNTYYKILSDLNAEIFLWNRTFSKAEQFEKRHKNDHWGAGYMRSETWKYTSKLTLQQTACIQKNTKQNIRANMYQPHEAKIRGPVTSLEPRIMFVR